MPRGDNPNSRANVIPVTRRTTQEQRELCRKAGIASGRARAFNKTIRENVAELCTPDALEAIAKRLIQMAEHGNLKAIMLLLDILGESPRYQLQKDMLELKRRELKLREQGW